MRVHLRWIGVAALAVVASNVHEASAQYAPYRPQQQALPQVGGYPTTATGGRSRPRPLRSRLAR